MHLLVIYLFPDITFKLYPVDSAPTVRSDKYVLILSFANDKYSAPEDLILNVVGFSIMFPISSKQNSSLDPKINGSAETTDTLFPFR